MKNILIVLALILPLQLFAQHEIKTLVKRINHVSGFGGPDFGVLRLNNQYANIAGGNGAVLINHKFYVGGGGFGVAGNLHVNDEKAIKYGFSENTFFNVSYGGILFGYIFFWDRPVHFAFNTMLLKGVVVVQDFGVTEKTENLSVFAIKPRIDLEINLLSFMRISAGAFYLVSNLQETENFLSEKDLSSTGFELSFRFGSF